MVGGLALPNVDLCMQDDYYACNAFKRQDCDYKGNVVFSETTLSESISCQKWLETIGFAYNAVYFTYSSRTHTCTFYDSSEMDCASMSGPIQPGYDKCVDSGMIKGKSPFREKV